MFCPADRSHLRSTLLHYADKDPRISGSAAADREHPWSDIDLAFAIADPLAPSSRLPLSGPWLYRVFLLPGSLQVDLAFVPASDLPPLSPNLR